MMQVNRSTDTFVLKTLIASSFMFTTVLMTYSYIATMRSIQPAKKIVVVESQKTSQPLAPNTVKAKLVAKKHISPDTVHLDFRFVEKGAKVPVGKHVKVFCKNPSTSSTWNGAADAEAGKEVIERKYTPVSSSHEGFVLVVKAYKANEKFCDGGKVSQYLANLCTDEAIEIALPFGLMEYMKPGEFKKSKLIVNAKFVGMLAGGSGITPMLRLLESSLADPTDTTKFALIFANRSDCDVLMKERLDKLAETHSKRFKVAYTLTRPSATWKGESGLIDQNMIKAYMPPPSPETLILCCGPPAMIKTCCKENLDRLGYAPNLVWDF